LKPGLAPSGGHPEANAEVGIWPTSVGITAQEDQKQETQDHEGQAPSSLAEVSLILRDSDRPPGIIGLIVTVSHLVASTDHE
jgi:hypothetical protein